MHDLVWTYGAPVGFLKRAVDSVKVVNVGVERVSSGNYRRHRPFAVIIHRIAPLRTAPSPSECPPVCRRSRLTQL